MLHKLHKLQQKIIVHHSIKDASITLPFLFILLIFGNQEGNQESRLIIIKYYISHTKLLHLNTNTHTHTHPFVIYLLHIHTAASKTVVVYYCKKNRKKEEFQHQHTQHKA